MYCENKRSENATTSFNPFPCEPIQGINDKSSNVDVLDQFTRSDIFQKYIDDLKQRDPDAKGLLTENDFKPLNITRTILTQTMKPLFIITERKEEDMKFVFFIYNGMIYYVPTFSLVCFQNFVCFFTIN